MNNRPARFLAMAPFAALVLALPAAAQTANPAPPVQNETQGNQAALDQNDRSFVQEAGAGGLAEVDFAKLANQKSSDDSVKRFAQHMIQDHTKANEQLAGLAKSDDVPVPTELDPAHRAIRARLEKLSGANFDRAYIEGQVADHQKTVELFQHESSTGRNPGLKNFATETLPTLRGHLRMATALEGELTPQASAPGTARERSGSSMPRTESPRERTGVQSPPDGAAALNRQELQDLGPPQNEPAQGQPLQGR